MVKFKARTIQAAPLVDCLHEDLGLQYAERITVGAISFIILTSKEDVEKHANCVTFRHKRIQEEMMKRGLFFEEDTVEPNL